MGEEILTLKEMKARYDSEWVLITDPELDNHHEVIRGRVACHSKNRDEVYRKGLEIRPKSAAFRYLGEAPENMAFAL
jgi:hypothetical protein